MERERGRGGGMDDHSAFVQMVSRPHMHSLSVCLGERGRGYIYIYILAGHRWVVCFSDPYFLSIHMFWGFGEVRNTHLCI